MPATLRVTRLYEYPVKSCTAVLVDELELDATGPVGDRRWMLVDRTEHFVTQRTEPTLALVRVARAGDGLRVEAPGRDPLAVLPPGPDAVRRRVSVWNTEAAALDAGDRAAAWFSAYLGREVRLVRQDDLQPRTIDPLYAQGTVSFADGFPLHLLTEASIEAATQRVGLPADPRRFRPNVVVGGSEAWAEDRWSRIRVGELELSLPKPCARCTMIGVDPDKGVGGAEPLRDLATWRRFEGTVVVGQNAVHATPGVIRVGDPVEVLEVAR